MPQIVELDLAAVSTEIERLHLPDETPATVPHWLLVTWYGRDFLKLALKRLRPDLAVRQYVHAPELDDYLEMVIDQLGLREWKEPHTAMARARYLMAVGAMFPALLRGERSMHRFTI